ncbi:conserved hypothetical protein [Afipia carboxidovorans OM5]|uniref:Uncharacterized protein n=1 Tax=Afipia carboxidovorans (strain ATCC 49405 / DSM 1227 / KCTC 32145 / OM5) TaxID=504832 RepID=B6JGL4_AFIC5|nr:DUF6719 family protein [Afipia carboxidovorans]ACI93439.1 conserved hypothetical protein [Afipia carboxidovorans OM5]AEI02850.1 hypothetical protein OCA4_c17120 [Afipia carboxidovorans OM4]AEI06426.1 hypothetical protein OCA5_c17120 [Afipia carboxidovorans OM5]BEV47226.1 hypothetical protein CRBSH125_34090 [Afipia carboxidovorans]
MRATLILAALVLAASTLPSSAQTVSRESDITHIRLGQRILVDDGSCPTGQIKQVTGTTLTPQGISTVKQCVPRRGARPN